MISSGCENSLMMILERTWWLSRKDPSMSVGGIASEVLMNQN
jgi:hypothetical protein